MVEPTDDAALRSVIIAGGGLVGLATAAFLAEHGVRATVLERLRGGSVLPRGAHFHVRTMEQLRAIGVEQDVRAQSEREFVPEGAIVAMDSLAGRKLADIVPSLNEGVDENLSPCRRVFVTQPGLERILRRAAIDAGTELIEGVEIVEIGQDDDAVAVTVRDLDDGTTTHLRGRYLVGADGAHSVVREAAGIPLQGRGVFSNSMTIYFTADLAAQMLGKPLSVIYINNPVFGGFFRLSKDCQSGFLAINTIGDPATNPDASNPAKDTSTERLVELVRIGAGVPELDVRIDGVARWRSVADLAASFQHGRIFLAGDAAHVMPPNGGFGGNTGIQDAYDIAWKLALVLAGTASPALLDTYDTERRPVGKLTTEQAFTRYVTRTAPYLEVDDLHPLVADLEVELGYVYRSDAIQPDEHGVAASDGDVADHGDPRLTRGRPGTRAPHLWINVDGQRRSIIDLFGRGFVVLAGSGGRDWCEAAGAVAGELPGVGLDAYYLDGDKIAVLNGRFEEACGVSDGGAVLVRPDGFVAWRANADVGDRAAAVREAMRRALCLA